MALLSGEVRGAVAGMAAAEQESRPTATAFVLFISGDTPAMLPMNVGELRLAGTDLLNRALSAAGQLPIDPSELAPLLIRWRVRNTWTLPLGLLTDINGELGAERLFVAHLIARPGRLVMIGRYVDTTSGALLAVEIAEDGIPIVGPFRQANPGQDWRVNLGHCCRAVVAAPLQPEASGPPNLMMLPAQATGCDDQFAAMATYCLLQAMLSDQRWRPLDPSVLITGLQDSGFYPGLLDHYGFALLRQQYQLSHVLLPNLIAFDNRSSRSSTPVAAPGKGIYRSGLLDAFNLTVLQIDFATGAIGNAGNRYNDTNHQAGWFGVMSEDSVLRRLQTAAHELWADLSKNLEES